MVNKWLVAGILAVAIFVFSASILPLIGVPATLLATILVIALAIGGLSWAGVKILPRNTGMWVFVGSVALLFITGTIFGVGLSNVGKLQASFAGSSLPSPISTTPAVAGVSAGVSSVNQTTGACVVTSDLQRGAAASLTILSQDLEANNPPASQGTGVPIYVYRAKSVADISPANLLGNTTLASAGATFSGLATGDVVTLVGDNQSTYYIEPLEGQCLATTRPSVTLNIHTLPTNTQGNMTVFDGSSELAAGSSGCDYTVTMGAGETKPLTYKFKLSTANTGMPLGGFATATFQNISQMYPTGSSALNGVASPLDSNGISPLFVKNVNVTTSSTVNTAVGITSTYTIYRVKQPKIMHAFDVFQTDLAVKATSGSDPSGACNSTITSGVAVVALDTQTHRGSDGLYYNDVYMHTLTQDNAGLQENLTNPGGKDFGTFVQIA